MKSLILFFTLVIVGCTYSINAEAYNPTACKIFDASQKKVLRDAFNAGKKRKYSWTLAAIVWQETSAGKTLINWNDPSFGAFQINIKTAAKRYKAVTTGDQLILAEELHNNINMGAMAAMDELDFWKGVHKGNWSKMVASYNGGYNWKGKHPQAYRNNLLKKVNFLKKNRCMFY